MATIDDRLRQLDGVDLVTGETDSERFFALITSETRRHRGDVFAGISSAVRWVVEHVQVVSLNFVLTTPTDLWAFRFPQTNTLFLLQRAAGGGTNAQRDFTGTGSALRTGPRISVNCRVW